MINTIFGLPGAGKSSLLAHLLYEQYFEQGDILLDKCREKITEANLKRRKPLSMPKKAPFYVPKEFKVKFLDGYESYFEPYEVNPYYLGLKNDAMRTQYILPGAQIFIPEAQKYYDSRQSATFPRHVSTFFEEHRHYGINFWLDAQRPDLIDKNIRMLANRFIEVWKMVHTYADNGAIERTTWYCREFKSNADVEAYLETGVGAGNYVETTYVHEGNIFEIFDSFSQFDDFLPEDGEDFINLEPLKPGEKPSDDLAIFYKRGEPREYRGGKPKAKPEKKKEKAA